MRDQAPTGAIAALFDAGTLQKSLKPKLLMALSLRDGVSVDGCLVQCLFARDDALSTELFTQAYCAHHKLPRFDARWGFIDVVASRKAPCGALLVLHAVLNAARSRPPLQGVCAVAVTGMGQRLLKSLNFTCYPTATTATPTARTERSCTCATSSFPTTSASPISSASFGLTAIRELSNRCAGASR